MMTGPHHDSPGLFQKALETGDIGDQPPSSAFLLVDEASVAEHVHVVGHRRLSDPQLAGEFPDRAGAAGGGLEDEESGRITERLMPAGPIVRPSLGPAGWATFGGP